MSMNAVFVQVEEAEIAGFEADPDAVDALFTKEAPPTTGLQNLAATAQARLSAMGPEQMATVLSRLPAPLRQQLEKSMGRTSAQLQSGQGKDDLLKLLQEKLVQRGRPAGKQRETLSLEKAWHGVHYVLTGSAEPGATLRSQAVLGGVELGDDPEGFSGYGPARYFRAAQVRELSEQLSRPEVEAEAAARFDLARMSELQIYPGWSGEQDKEWVMDGFRRLRDFYASAAANGRAVVTSLV
ncbi:MAG TPA: YfbM family protein [Acidobacteriaceae bacterium]|nr:YfbM family protein [Acidobacteriaceae bacterium]